MTINRSALLVSVSFLLGAVAAQADDDDILALIKADRLEYQSDDSTWLWDMQGWFGGDYQKFWWKTEGQVDDGSANEAELQLLYSRAISPFFDLQFGLRHDFDPEPSRSFVVVGIQGLAPQWIEIDAAAFISEDGDISARFEAEYDLLLTQHLVLQPRFEVDVAFQDVPELALGDGVTSTDLEVRLRYEIRREIAPYLGISWHKSYGGTADFLENAGQDDYSFSVLAGIRLWF